ncbi:hypothetical protein HPB48_006267 [Haemaphysalis longicornis]|uniref:Uncharacterized protein n=1 Tax=Haemaphysalis longicornis TaxID=44386 RepID=A0A9J6GRW1_HAELO|nr:hypothetical protein HPB48_006267 [Haemaphysalis longicornis]
MDRSWSVAAAGSLAAFFTVVMITTSGFFYVSFLEEFQVDRESASWPTSVLSIVSHSSGEQNSNPELQFAFAECSYFRQQAAARVELVLLGGRHMVP